MSILPRTPPPEITDDAGAAFGQRLKSRRKARQMTLNDLSLQAGISVSTISKVENGAASPTYDVIVKLAKGLGVPVGEMFAEGDETRRKEPRPSGWQVVGRSGEGELLSTPNYEYRYLCSNLKTRKMVPVLSHIKAGSIADFGPLSRHGGEEFLYVLKGKVVVYSEFYTPEELNEGDHVYLDSAMGHAYIRSSEQEALVLCCMYQDDEEG